MTAQLARARSRRVATSVLTLSAVGFAYAMVLGAAPASAVSPKQPTHPLVFPQGKAIPTSVTVPTANAGVPLVGDFDGDGKADFAVVTTQGVEVLNSNGQDFTTPDAPFYGSVDTVAEDFNGDGLVDLIAINPDSIWVEYSTGSALSDPTSVREASDLLGTRATLVGKVQVSVASSQVVAVNDDGATFVAGRVPYWSVASVPFYGTKATMLAEISDGAVTPGYDDLVAVNDTSTWLLRNNRHDSLSAPFLGEAPAQWSATPFYGTRVTLSGHFTNAAGDELVAVNDSSTWTMSPNGTGTGFSAPAPWSAVPFYGTVANLVGDVDGDGLDDLIAVNGDSVWVMLSNGNGFDAPEEWIS